MAHYLGLRSAALWLLPGAVVLTACTAAPPPAATDGPVAARDSVAVAEAHLVDTAIPPAVAGEAGWGYQLSAEADFTGDGRPERAVLTARVEMSRGRPMWDDGQPWQVYVEEPDGGRTYLYAQRLQLGTLTMRASLADSGQAATLVLLEQLPDRLTVYEATYGGPGRASIVVRFQRDLDPRGDIASPRLP